VAPIEKEISLHQRIVVGVVTLALVLGLVPTAALADVVAQPAAAETTEQTVGSTDETADGQADASAAQASDGSEPVAQTVDAASQEKIGVTVSIIGADADGNDETWATPVTITLDKGATAADLTEQLLSQAQLSASYGDSAYGWYLSTITSPYDSRTLGYDATSGKYWQLFYNGKPASLGAGSITLAGGDSVVWYYSAWNASLPDDSDKPVSGGVTAPDTASEWPETEAGGNVTTAPTSSVPTTASWMIDLKDEGSTWASVSGPLIVDGKLVVAVNGTLKLISNTSSSAAVEKTLTLDGSIDYTARPVYADGVIYVPLSGGAVEAVDYGTFSKLWTSEKTAEGEQSSCSLRVVDLEGRKAVVFGTAAYDSDYSIASGSLLALDAATGTMVWSRKNTSSGWYWTGVLRVGDYLLAGDAAGTMCAYTLDGTEVSPPLDLHAAVNSDPVAYGDDGALVVTRDGVLHKLSLSSTGRLTDTSLKVLDGCVAAPTVTGTTAVVVGGTGDQGSTTTLALVDLSSMTVTRTVTSTGGAALPVGAIKAPALVSVQLGGTYAYFTVNYADNPNSTWTGYGSGGNLYVYKLGDLEASLLYAPSSVNANYCDSPVICDAAGNLYYLNDSGFLVRLSATDAGGDTGGTDGSGFTPASGASGQGTTTNASLFSGLRSADVASTEKAADSAGASARVTDDASTAESGVALASEVPGTDAAEAGSTALPIWPIVGMAVGVAVLLWALVGRRRENGGERA